jgi:dTDP-4-dehydrorhamnose 3,5-epimerase
MTLSQTPIDGLKVIHCFHQKDHRGNFVKTFHDTQFQEAGINFELKESFYSTSYQNVIRGMHFHHSPLDHAKIVFALSGEILDVALDIRKDSPTYGQYYSIQLNDQEYNAIYIPKGFAHGFQVLSEQATVMYLVDGVYSAAHDDGILFNSFGLEWNGILSERDLSFKRLEDL